MSKSWNWEVIPYEPNAWPVFINNFKQNPKDFDSFDIWDDRPQIGSHKLSDSSAELTVLGYLDGKLVPRPKGGKDFDYDYVSGTWVKKTWSKFDLPPILTSELNNPNNGGTAAWAYDMGSSQWFNVKTGRYYKPPTDRRDNKDFTYLGSTAYVPDKVYRGDSVHLAYTTRGWIDLGKLNGSQYDVLPYHFKNDPFTSISGSTDNTSSNYLLVFGVLIGGIVLLRNI